MSCTPTAIGATLSRGPQLRRGLHHLQVALAARVAVRVRRMPDAEDRGHLATGAVRPDRADAADAAQFRAIEAGEPIGDG